MQTQMKAIRTGGSGEEVELKTSRDGDLRVAQYLPPYTMLAASGKVFAFTMTAGTAKAPVTSAPTTSPEWSIYNANADGGPHIVLLKVGLISASGSLGLGVCVMATVGVGDQTIQSASYSGYHISCLDGSLKIPNAFLANNKGIINTQPAWMVFGAEETVANVYVGAGLVANVDGAIVAPPHNSVFVEVVGAAGNTDLYDICIVVAEVQLDT